MCWSVVVGWEDGAGRGSPDGCERGPRRIPRNPHRLRRAGAPRLPRCYEINGELIIRASKEADPARRSESTRRQTHLLAVVAELSTLPVGPWSVEVRGGRPVPPRPNLRIGRYGTGARKVRTPWPFTHRPPCAGTTGQPRQKGQQWGHSGRSETRQEQSESWVPGFARGFRRWLAFSRLPRLGSRNTEEHQ